MTKECQMGNVLAFFGAHMDSTDLKPWQARSGAGFDSPALHKRNSGVQRLHNFPRTMEDTSHIFPGYCAEYLQIRCRINAEYKHLHASVQEMQRIESVAS